MKTICEGCGKQRAAGGHRFCWACLGQILSQPAPAERPAWAKSTYTYPPIGKKGGDRR